MLEGLYSAAAGMETAQTQLDTVSNNMANEDTPGYQAQELGFSDLLYNTDDDDPSTAIVGAGSTAQTIGYSQAQGALEQTGNPLDLGMSGDGYFEVRQADGTIGLTKNGTFQLNARGQITTDLGMELVPPITVPKGTQASQISVAANGAVSVNKQKIGQIQLVTVTAPDKLLPQGNSVYSATAGSGPITAAKGVTLQQGFLEQSNVDLDTEITSMEQAEQAYSMGSKAVQFEGQFGQIAAELKAGA
jgi:flagellar basal-body rod protein FlgG